MISNQEKKDKLNTILEMLGENHDSIAANQALHRLLLEDCGGILCKYMPIKKYTVPTITEGTLHFSSPADFNDPFDCKVGIDLRSMCEAMFLKEFDNLEDYFSEFVSVVDGIKSLDAISSEKLHIIMQWLNSKRLMDFLSATKGVKKSDDEINEIMFNNFDIVVEIVTPLLNTLPTEMKMPITNFMFPKILENMTDDGKLHLLESNGTFADYIKTFGVEDTDADEISLTERAYEKIHPGDLEPTESLRKTFETIEQQLNGSLYSLFKVCCLCTSNKNRLMWSHYADSHKGICIEYDFSGCSDTENQPMPVHYSNARPKFPWKVAVDHSPEVQREATIHFMDALLNKDEAWSYENEWRLLIKAEPGVDDVPAPPIRCIYIGALCPQEKADEIIAAAVKMNIPVKKMTVDRGEYELHATEISIPAKE